jgi:hypothetical protein
MKYINYSANMVGDLITKNILDLMPKTEELEEEKAVVLKKEEKRMLLPGKEFKILSTINLEDQNCEI